MTAGDPNTYSNHQTFECQHIDFDWQVDFSSKIIKGSVACSFYCRSSSSLIVLDTQHLLISGVSVLSTDGTYSEAKFNCTEPLQFGSSLEIFGNFIAESTYTVKIAYETTAQCTALQWLSPDQTKDRLLPFLFSQSQAIHARTMFPCQDTPSARFTYKARVSIADSFPCPMQVVMSANLRKVLEGNLNC